MNSVGFKGSIFCVLVLIAIVACVTPVLGQQNDLALLKYNKMNRIPTPNDTVDPNELLKITAHEIVVANEQDSNGKAINGLTIYARTTKPLRDVWDNIAVWNDSEAFWNLSSITINDGDMYNVYPITDADNVPVEIYASRTVNKTLFTTSGYQEVNVTFRFYNRSWEGCGVRIGVLENSLVNPVIMDNFETNFPYDHVLFQGSGKELELYAKCSNVTNKEYYMKGFINVNIKKSGVNVTYKPYIWVRYVNHYPYTYLGITNSPEFSNADIYIRVNTTSPFNWTIAHSLWKMVEMSQITINESTANQPPVADFAYYPLNPSVNESIAFNASNSYDPDGSIVDYSWDFNGDGFVDANSTTPYYTYTYSQPGIYTVILTVTDDNGASSTFSQNITISTNNQPPVANFTYTPLHPTVGETVTFNASSSYDPDGSVIWYHWEFGDGNATNTTNPVINYVYSSSGTYNVTLMVIDDGGLSNSISKEISVSQTSGHLISDCTIIDQPGYYVLTQDIIDNTYDKCIQITANNVVFDGNGHIIDGVDNGNTYGIYVENQSYAELSNITLKNTIVSDWFIGVHLSNLKQSKIESIEAYNNSIGISLSSSSYSPGDNIIENCSIHDNSPWYEGLSISGINNTIINNKIYNNGKGIGLDYSSSLNRIVNNNIGYNGYGIFFGEMNYNNTIENNDINNNTYYGIRICSGGEHNTISNNTITNSNTGIKIEETSNNNFVMGNTIMNNRTENAPTGILIVNSTDNIIYNNLVSYYRPVGLYNSTNTWNTSLSPGTNIIGGNYIGGNAWLKPDGTGFSQTCDDNDGDGICDQPYYLDSSNVDYLPLKWSEEGSSGGTGGDLTLLRCSDMDRVSTDEDTINPNDLLTHTAHEINIVNIQDGYGKAIDGLQIHATTTKPIIEVWDDKAVWSGNEAYWDLSNATINDGSNYYTGVVTEADNMPVEIYASRTVNKTLFTTSGYQEVNVTFRFYNRSWETCEVRIEGSETDLVRPEVLTTFHTDFPYQYGFVKDGTLFVGAPCNQIEDKEYYLKGIIKVNLKQSGINLTYKPRIWVTYISHKPKVNAITSSLKWSTNEIQIIINTSSEFNWSIDPSVWRTAELYQIAESGAPTPTPTPLPAICNESSCRFYIEDWTIIPPQEDMVWMIRAVNNSQEIKYDDGSMERYWSIGHDTATSGRGAAIKITVPSIPYHLTAIRVYGYYYCNNTPEYCDQLLRNQTFSVYILNSSLEYIAGFAYKYKDLFTENFRWVTIPVPSNVLINDTEFYIFINTNSSSPDEDWRSGIYIGCDTSKSNISPIRSYLIRYTTTFENNLAMLEYHNAYRYLSDQDSVTSGIYAFNLEHWFKIRNLDDSNNKPINGFNFSLTTEKPIKYMWWSDHGYYSGNQAFWNFSDLTINDGGYLCCLTVGVDDSSVLYTPVEITRHLDKTKFYSAGYQQINVTFRFLNRSADWCYLHVGLDKNDLVESQILWNTLETDFPYQSGWHGYGDSWLEIGANCSQLEDKTYYASILIHHSPKTNSPVVVKPRTEAYILFDHSILNYGRAKTVVWTPPNSNVNATLNTNSEFDWHLKYMDQLGITLNYFVISAENQSSIQLTHINEISSDGNSIGEGSKEATIYDLFSFINDRDFYGMQLNVTANILANYEIKRVYSNDSYTATSNRAVLTSKIKEGDSGYIKLRDGKTTAVSPCTLTRTISGTPSFQGTYTVNVSLSCSKTDYDYAYLEIEVPQPELDIYNSYILSYTGSPSSSDQWHLKYDLRPSQLSSFNASFNYYIALDGQNNPIPFIVTPTISLHLINEVANDTITAKEFSIPNGFLPATIISTEINASQEFNWNLKKFDETMLTLSRLFISNDTNEPQLEVVEHPTHVNRVSASSVLSASDSNLKVVAVMLYIDNMRTSTFYKYIKENGSTTIEWVPVYYTLSDGNNEVNVSAYIDENGTVIVFGYVPGYYRKLAVAKFDSNGNFEGLYTNPECTTPVTGDYFKPALVINDYENATSNFYLELSTSNLKLVKHEFPLGAYKLQYYTRDTVWNVNVTPLYNFEVINLHPFASVTSPSQANVGETITFNASPSYDPDGVIVSYIWDFDDGNITITANPTIQHTFVVPALYEVRLIVEDDEGATNYTFNEISIVKQVTNSTTVNETGDITVIEDPTLVVEANVNETQNGSIIVNATISGSNDTINAANLLVAGYKPIKYLNITTNATNVTVDRVTIKVHYNGHEIEDVDENSLSIYYWNGSAWYRLRDYIGEVIPSDPPLKPLKVYGAGVNTSANFVYATINHTSGYALGGNAKPTACFTFSNNLPEGESFTFDGSCSYDKDGSITSYIWNFGDGSTASGMIVSHTYYLSGSYVVNLTVTDDKGAKSSIEHKVTVLAYPVISSVSFDPKYPLISEVIDFSANTNDPDGQIISYEWNFGDGIQLTTSQPSAMHKYLQAGDYSVKLTVRDNDGLEKSTALSLTVYAKVDTDGDGIEDWKDVCPTKKETFNNYKDDDGCPDTPPVSGTSSGGTSSGVGGGGGGLIPPKLNAPYTTLYQTAKILSKNMESTINMPSDIKNLTGITSITLTSNYEATPWIIVSAVKNLPKELQKPSNTYRYFEFNMTYKGFLVRINCDINFRVPKEIGDVMVLHYNTSTNKWEKIKTEKTGEDGNFRYYKSNVISNSMSDKSAFGIFAIVKHVETPTSMSTPITTQTLKPTQPQTLTPTPSVTTLKSWSIPGFEGLISACVIVFFGLLKRKKIKIK